MNKKLYFLFTIMFFTLMGCASSPNVPLSQKFWQNNKNQRVVVASDKMTNPGLYQEGQEGLLDILANKITTDKFNKYLEHYSTQSIGELPEEFVLKLRQHNIHTSIYGNIIDINALHSYLGDKRQFADKDFSSMRSQIGASKLLLISAKSIGAVRKYYGFIPLGAPKALCVLEGRLVDLTDNRILWRYTSNVTVPVNGAWDQPPAYPNFSSALNEAISIAKEELLNSFFSS